MAKLLGWNKTQGSATRGYFLRAPDGLDPWWTITKHGMGYGAFYFTVERGGEHLGQVGTLYLAKQVAEDDAYNLLRNRSLKSNPSRARSAELAHHLFGGPRKKVTKRFLKNESVGWNGFAVKIVKYGKDQTCIRGTGVSERCVPTSQIEDIPNWEWQNRWDKQWNGKKANPRKNPIRGGGVNARGGWRHVKGSGVWLARYASGPSYQIVRHEDGNYWLEAGRWSKAADSFKGGVNSGVYRTLSEAQLEAGNMRRRWALGRQK